MTRTPIAAFSGLARLVLTLLVLLATADIGPAVQDLGPPTIKRWTLSRNTEFATEVWSIEAREPGPTVLVVAGIHGDERAGVEAALAISNWSIDAGRLVVVPRANPPALAAGTRRIPGVEDGEGDLNRRFADRVPSGSHAKSLWRLVRQVDPDWLLDLHEGFAVRRLDPDSVGHSVITCDDPVALDLARRLVDRVDRGITDEEKRFTLLRNPIRGSLAARAWESREVRSMILETCKREGRLPERARRHREMVHEALTDLGMGPSSPETLVDPDRQDRELCVALYGDSGSSSNSLKNTRKALAGEVLVLEVDATDILAGSLDPFHAVILPGGTMSGQARSLGSEGRERLQEFVRRGGGYLGICAGAYLGAANYTTSLGLLPVDVIDREHWNRGIGNVEVRASRPGRRILGAPARSFDLYYYNGPILAPTQEADQEEAPPYVTLLTYRGDIAKPGVPGGVMPGTPAAIAGDHGSGRVILLGPHPEATEGREPFLVRALSWLARQE